MILVMGDSLSAGYGLDPQQGWIFLLQQKIRSQGLPHVVVNASVSGETTAGGLARLPAALDRNRPKIVLVELGGNDGLRGQPAQALRTNLERMVDLTRKAGAVPVLFEMRIPENYGPAYANSFHGTFAAVAQERKVALVPFLLAEIALEPDRWFQDDGIHPNAAAQPRLVEAVWPTLQPLLTH
ncbi:MAG TPA: arylesterase [Nevskiaceae bacterium]|nr:arylesterase [Nevskiaceae bacterium]